MNVSIKVSLQSQKDWNPKMNSVIFVNSEEDKYLLWELLVEQDEYWLNYPNNINIIQVKSEKDFASMGELTDLCHYCHRVDIYDVEELQKKVDFFIYQERERYD